MVCACPKKFNKNERRANVGKREERCFMKSERRERERREKQMIFGKVHAETKEKGQEKREKVNRKS